MLRGAAIPEPDTDTTCTARTVDEATRPRTLADYYRLDQFYTNKSAMHPNYPERGFRVEAAVLHTRGTDTLPWVISRASYGPSGEVR